MKKLLPWIRIVYTGLMFFLTMCIFIIPIWLTGFWNEPQRTGKVIWLCRTWMAIFFPLAGVRLFIRGKAFFQAGQNYIIVCNHSSLMDVPVSSPGIPGANKTIAKTEMAKIPLFGIIYRRGSVLVDRKSEKSRRDSYLEMRRVLELGMHMCIYPEGTRNQTGKPLKDFHNGAFRLACETGKPIMPALITGTGRMLPSLPPYDFRPGKLQLEFLSPVPVQVGDDPIQLQHKVFHIMWAHLEQHSSLD